MTPYTPTGSDTTDTKTGVPKTLLDLLRCPSCWNSVTEDGNALVCTGCGLSYAVDQGIAVMLPPSPALESPLNYRKHYELDAQLYDYFEERTGATEHSERRLREFVLWRLGNPRSVLDVGCGSAWLASKRHRSSALICSLDISSVNPKKAVQLYPSASHVGVAADSYALPFGDGTFESVVATEIIEHVPDPEAFVGELFRVVEPGGRLVLSTPYKEKLRTELCIHCNQLTPHNAHLHSFDESKLLGYFQNLPVRSSRYFTFNNKLLLFARTHPVMKLFPFGVWRLIDALANRVFARPVNIVLEIQKS